MNPFDYVNSITYTKENLCENSKIYQDQYNPFIVNKALSYFPDCVMHANEMNISAHIDNKMQYDYLFNAISKRKRFSKWEKMENSKILDDIIKIFNCSRIKARNIETILTPKELDMISAAASEGGSTNQKS